MNAVQVEIKEHGYRNGLLNNQMEHKTNEHKKYPKLMRSLKDENKILSHMDISAILLVVESYFKDK